MKHAQFCQTILLGLMTLLARATTAATLHVSVQNQQQNPLEYAVVYVNETVPLAATEAKMIDQVDKEFVPYVTAIQQGSAINFPNNDNIRHQVYSFSQTRQFEIPLYSGNPPRPVVFDETGVVAMACNIHDWMSAYVYVVATDKYVVTNAEGQGVIADLPEGQYEILVWHPTAKDNVQATSQTVHIANQDQSLGFTVTQKPVLRAWRAPVSAQRRGY